MSLWEYKHITSGPHGFATPALLESYLNQLGKDEWEIISYQTLPNNPLAFNGVARRTTLRDWTLETAAAAAAKVEADKIRAEFAAKFQGNTPSAGADTTEKPASIIAETAAPEDGLRKLRDTERDNDPDAADEGDDWDNWDNLDDDLPTFFEAIKPHLRKNQRGPGQSVGISFLAKRWEQTEGDLINALKECGFVIPETEDAPPEHLEFEGELYWLNLNNRHELFLNTREKPRPVFRVAQAKKLDPADPAAAVLADEATAALAEKTKRETERLAREAEQAARRAEHEARRAAAQAAREAAQAERAAAPASSEPGPGTASPSAAADTTADTTEAGAATAGELGSVSAPAPKAGAPKPEIAAGPLPEGEELLAAIRAQMRRNRRGPGYSGSTSYLARAFKHSEADLVAALAALGLLVPENANDKPVKTTIGGYVYWLNKDSRGGIWINGDEARGPKPEGGTPRPTENGNQKTDDDGRKPGAEATAGEPRAEVTAAASDISPIVPTSESAPVPSTESAPAVEKPVSAEPVRVASESAPATATMTSPDSPLAAIRLLLKPNKRGSGVSAEVGFLARALDQDLQVFLTKITDLGLALPATEEDKPTFVERAGEIFWLNKNPKDGSVWVNAKAAKSAAKKSAAGAAKPRAKKTPKET